MVEFFEMIHWSALFKIVALDIMLGVDNAVVIALACAALPAAMRTRAILMGTAGAVILRGVLLAIASYLMEIPYLKIFAGAYLLYIGYKLLIDSGEEEAHVKQNDKIFGAIWTIIVADFMMSLDNVLAVAGAATSAGDHSTVYAVAGIALSIPIIVFGASVLTKIMDRFPIIVWIGGGLIGWVGAEMIVSDAFVKNHIWESAITIFGMHIPVYQIIGFIAVIVAALATSRLSTSKLTEA